MPVRASGEEEAAGNRRSSGGGAKASPLTSQGSKQPQALPHPKFPSDWSFMGLARRTSVTMRINSFSIFQTPMTCCHCLVPKP